MPFTTINGVTGLDNVQPLYDREAPWKIWALFEIWMGGTGGHKFIPKVKDYVVDTDTNVWYIVDHLDPVTMIPTLRELFKNNVSTNFSATDLLFGIGNPVETFRVYIDKRTFPYNTMVDSRVIIPGSASISAKLYRYVNNEPIPISKIYDANGQFISENIPLELVRSDSHETVLSKSILPFHVSEDLEDNEVVLVVAFNAAGTPTYKRQLVVENTSFLRGTDNNRKYVSHISMKCPFLNDSAPNQIDFPLNIPTNAINAIGVVHYSDGSTFENPVDGNLFQLWGLDKYISSIEGRPVPLVLSYQLRQGESAEAGVGLEARGVTALYTIKTVNPNNSYSVKLFCYPEWVSPVDGYRLRWFLYSLDRNNYIDVTPYVQFDPNHGVFNPLGFGYAQSKVVSINLRDIGPGYKPFVHVQGVVINLFGAPNQSATPWTVGEVQSGVMYGRQLHLDRISGRTYSVKNGINDQVTWLNRLYYETVPIIDNAVEVTPPRPTHFTLIANNVALGEFSINDWDKPIAVGVDIPLYSTVYLRFVRRVGDQVMELSMAGLTTLY